MILTPLQKLPNYVGILAKIIVATSFQWLPKVQKIVQSGHTVSRLTQRCPINQFSSSQKMKKKGQKIIKRKYFPFCYCCCCWLGHCTMSFNYPSSKEQGMEEVYFLLNQSMICILAPTLKV